MVFDGQRACDRAGKSPILYEVGRAGIAGYEDKDESLTDAVRRIQLIHADYVEYLAGCRDDAYDVIYFDPMFCHPVKRREMIWKASGRQRCMTA